MFKKTVLVAALVLLLCSQAKAEVGMLFKSQREAWAAKGLSFDAHALEDYVSVFKGGSIHKDTWMGRFDFTTELDLEKAGLLKGGLLHVGMMNAHGGMKPTADGMVGDLQTLSNIEGPRTTRIYEAWYQQAVLDNKLSVKFGLQDYNSEFLVSDNAGLYINSAFGIVPVVSVGSSSVAIYPEPVPAVRLRFTPNEQFDFLAGFFQGNPLDPDTNEHSTHFGRNQGLLSMEEAQYHYKLPENGGLDGTAKAGFWYSSKHVQDVIDLDDNGDPVMYSKDYGFYGLVDQQLYKEGQDQGLSGFIGGGHAPRNRNTIGDSVMGGLNYTGLIPSRDKDVMGLAVTRAFISSKLRRANGLAKAETVYEWTYQFEVNESIHIQPDIQYIQRPNASYDIKNASVFTLRSDIHF